MIGYIRYQVVYQVKYRLNKENEGKKQRVLRKIK